MPVTNPDLLSPEPILYHPPNFEYAFKNPAFRAIDIVLSNMNNPNYIAKFYTDLEKLVHTAHMQDIWTAGGLAYAELQVGNYDEILINQSYHNPFSCFNQSCICCSSSFHTLGYRS